MALERRVIVLARVDGTVDRLPLVPAVEMRFERTYKIPINKLTDGPEAATNLYRLAWELDADATRKRGGVIPALDQWAEGIEALDFETEPIVPFEKVATATS